MSESRQNDATRRRGSLLDVAVVGGGMVGAATALALARSGFSVALIDARAPSAWAAADEVDLRVVGLAPSSVTLLDQLGVWSRIREARASEGLSMPSTVCCETATSSIVTALPTACLAAKAVF